MTNYPNIFDYVDYTEYLRDVMTHLKEHQRGFSFRQFSTRAGLGAPNAVQRAIDGKHTLTEDTIDRISKGLKHESKEQHYFYHLVRFNQSEDEDQKAIHERKMRNARRRHNAHSAEADSQEYLSRWYHVAVREFLFCTGATKDIGKIARCVVPPLNEEEVNHTLQLLRRLELVELGHNGWYATKNTFRAPTVSYKPLLRNYNHQSLSLAADAIETTKVEERAYATATFAIERSQKAAMFEKIKQYRNELMEEFMAAGVEGANPDEVIQIGLFGFPMATLYPEELGEDI